MRTFSILTAMFLGSIITSAGCKKDGGDDKKAETKAKSKAQDTDEEDEAEDDAHAMVVAGDDEIEGPIPPDTSMVFYTVEGALLPLACFDKEKGAMMGGAKCLDMVKEGSEVRVASTDQSDSRTVGGKVVPQCEAGERRKTALSVEGITKGADYRFATWPPSGMKAVKRVDKSSLNSRNTDLSDDEKAKLAAAIKASGSSATGELSAHQVAEIDVDGKGDKDKLYSVFIPHPRQTEAYSYSGAFLALDGDLDNLTLVEKSKTKRDVFEVRGTVDINGDNTAELWMRLTFEEGGGDRMVQIAGGKAKPLGKFTCGAVRG